MDYMNRYLHCVSLVFVLNNCRQPVLLVSLSFIWNSHPRLMLSVEHMITPGRSRVRDIEKRERVGQEERTLIFINMVLCVRTYRLLGCLQQMESTNEFLADSHRTVNMKLYNPRDN